MQTEFYQAYMKSPQWQQKKAERIDIDKGCVMCKRPLERIRKINVHHVTYERLGDENVLTDLCTLCGSCHVKLHNYYSRIRA